MLLAFLVAALLAAAEPAAQAAPATPEAAPAQTELKPGERRVKMKCRTEAANGSRIAKRRCMPLEEWQRQEEESQKQLGEMQGQTTLPSTCRQTGQPC